MAAEQGTWFLYSGSQSSATQLQKRLDVAIGTVDQSAFAGLLGSNAFCGIVEREPLSSDGIRAPEETREPGRSRSQYPVAESYMPTCRVDAITTSDSILTRLHSSQLDATYDAVPAIPTAQYPPPS